MVTDADCDAHDDDLRKREAQGAASPCQPRAIRVTWRATELAWQLGVSIPAVVNSGRRVAVAAHGSVHGLRGQKNQRLPQFVLQNH